MKVLSGVLLVCGLIMMLLFIGIALSILGTLLKHGLAEANSAELDAFIVFAMQGVSAFLLLFAAYVVNRFRP